MNSVRALAGVSAAVWKNNPAPQSQGLILPDHFAELRTNLNPALAELGINPIQEDPGIGTTLVVRAAHLQDVRDKVR